MISRAMARAISSGRGTQDWIRYLRPGWCAQPKYDTLDTLRKLEVGVISSSVWLVIGEGGEGSR